MNDNYWFKCFPATWLAFASGLRHADRCKLYEAAFHLFLQPDMTIAELESRVGHMGERVRSRFVIDSVQKVTMDFVVRLQVARTAESRTQSERRALASPSVQTGLDAQGVNHFSVQPAVEPAVQPTRVISEAEDGGRSRSRKERLRSPASAPHPVPTDLPSQPLPPPKAARSPRSAAPSSPPEFEWPVWAGEVTKGRWQDFKAHKWAHHKFKYRTIASEQAAINLLGEYFPSGKACVAALDEAMAKGWMFPLDPAKERGGGRNEEDENDD